MGAITLRESIPLLMGRRGVGKMSRLFMGSESPAREGFQDCNR
jgi:hypothetical protein